MFSVGVVLLVLERTGSAALAGATVACVTLPSILSGPVLGAWLDLTGRRRTIMVIDQILMATSLVLLVTLTGTAPNWCVPLLALIAGVTYPLSFGGFTSLIPLVVPKRAAGAGQRARGNQLQHRADRRAGAGRHDLRARRPGGLADRSRRC